MAAPAAGAAEAALVAAGAACEQAKCTLRKCTRMKSTDARLGSGLAELLGSLHLSLRVDVLDLGLAEDDVGVRGRRFEHVRLGQHEQNLPERKRGCRWMHAAIATNARFWPS